MPLVDARVWPRQRCQRPHNHFGVLVAVEALRRADDAEVDVAGIVEDGAASGSAAHQLDGRIGPAGAGRLLRNVREAVQVDLEPGVLVAAKDDARGVDVESEDGGVGRRDLQEAVLDGEVDEGVVGAGRVDLDSVGGVRGWGCER